MKKVASTTHKKPVKKTTTKRTSAKVAKSTKTTKSTAARKSQKVNYYPNRVPFLVAVLAVVTLFVLALMVRFNNY